MQIGRWPSDRFHEEVTQDTIETWEARYEKLAQDKASNDRDYIDVSSRLSAAIGVLTQLRECPSTRSCYCFNLLEDFFRGSL